MSLNETCGPLAGFSRGRRQSILSVAVVLVVALETDALAQTAMTFDEVRQTARESNFDIRQAEALLADVESQIDRAWVRMLPALTAQGGWVRNDRQIAIEMPEVPGFSLEEPVFQHESLFSASLELQVQLFDPAVIPHLSGAHLFLDAAAANLDGARNAIEVAAIELYYRMAATAALVLVSETNRDIRQESLRLIQARFDVNTATEFEVNRARTEVLQAELDLEELRQTQRRLGRTLGQLLGVGGEVMANGTPPTASSDPPGEIGDLVHSALAHRPDFHAAELELESSDDLVSAARFDYLPDVVASGRLQWSSEEAIDGENHAWMIMFGLNWNIFDHGLLRIRTSESETRRAVAEIRLEELHQQIEQEITDAVDDLTTAERRLSLAEERAGLAEEALGQANVGFESDVLTSLDVLEAQAAFLQAQYAVVSAQLDLDLAHWRLGQAVGDLSSD